MDRVARAGHRFVICLNLPDEGLYVVGEQEGNLMLIAVGDDGVLKGALAWESTDSVKAWMRHFRENNEPHVWSGFKKMGPQIGQVRFIQ